MGPGANIPSVPVEALSEEEQVCDLFSLSILSFVVSSAYPKLSLRLKRTPSMRLFVPNLVFKFLFFPSFSHSCFFVTYGCLPIFASRLFCLLSIVKNKTSVFVLFIHNLHFSLILS